MTKGNYIGLWIFLNIAFLIVNIVLGFNKIDIFPRLNNAIEIALHFIVLFVGFYILKYLKRKKEEETE